MRSCFGNASSLSPRGYADDNAAARPADDPVMKLRPGRDPLPDGSLASQRTLPRFENAARARDLLRLSEALAGVNGVAG